MAIPEELVEQFRTVALERLDRVEQAWASVRASLDARAGVLVHRELHTLKGESKMLGFSDVNVVCHKLEDLVDVARSRDYDVDDDFDLAVSLALRFMAMLVDKEASMQVDVRGLLHQIDLLSEIDPETKPRRPTGPIPTTRHTSSGPRVPQALRSRLGSIALDAFLEFTIAGGARRDRLRASWYTLRDLIGVHRAFVGPRQLAKHKTGALTLARELGKQVEVVIDVVSTEVVAEVLAAIDAALLHLVRNAIDHGIESPAERVAAGKPETGTIRLQSTTRSDRLTMTVTDDGRGIAFDEVRARAIDLELIPPNAIDIESSWLDLVCQPGFSTRTETSDVSGRGVGLDVVRNSIAEVGGTFSAESTRGSGTTWMIDIPLQRITFDGHVFSAPGLPMPVVIDSSWAPLPDQQVDAPIIDVAYVLGIVENRSVEGVRYFERDGQRVGVVIDGPITAATIRMFVSTLVPATCDVVIIERTEGLLLHLDRMLRA
jgi:two-component system, chemotaxis family, sensor kinase CheA